MVRLATAPFDVEALIAARNVALPLRRIFLRVAASSLTRRREPRPAISLNPTRASMRRGESTRTMTRHRPLLSDGQRTKALFSRRLPSRTGLECKTGGPKIDGSDS
jgi:hypothetical protein